MRHFATFAAVSLSLATGLTGCSTISAITSGNAPTVAEVQNDAVSTCGYLPTAETVTGILTKTNAEAAAGAIIGSTIANLICGAVTATAPKVSARRGVTIPTVYGIPVRGTFLK